MTLTAADSIRLKVHCLCYRSLGRHFQELDHLLVGYGALPRIDIPVWLHLVLQELKSKANYDLFPEAMESFLLGLKKQRLDLHSSLKGQPPELIDGVMATYDAIVQEIADTAQDEDDWDHHPFFDSCQTTAREIAKEFYAGTPAQPALEPSSLEFEWYDKGFHQRTAPAGWRADDRCLVLRFDFMHFTYQDYLCIPFLLFHEYVSHVYDLPVADCNLNRLILDGWLLGAQQELFEAKCLEGAYELRRYEQSRAVDNHLRRELQGGAPARGYHLARWLYKVIDDLDVSTRLARDLVLRPCAHIGERCFHFSLLCKKLDRYKQGWKSRDELLRKARTSSSIEDLFMAL